MRFPALLVMMSFLPLADGAAQAGRADRGSVGTGTGLDGWRGRTDRPEQRIADVHVAAHDGGYRITTGPHAIVWNPANRVSGDYEVRAQVTKTPDSVSSDEESYGLFIAGADLEGGRQNYLYCVVFGSGTVMVRHRGGSQTATLLGKTANAAIAKMDERGATDVISLWVRDGRVGCTVNGVEVFSAAVAGMVGPGKLRSTDGIYGLRVSHNLDILVRDFGVRPPPEGSRRPEKGLSVEVSRAPR